MTDVQQGHSPEAVQQPSAPPDPYAPYGYVAQRPTNTLAIVAFILAFFVSIAGVICGHIALGQIKRTGEGGHGLALAAVIIGWVSIGLTVVFVFVYVGLVLWIFGSVASSASTF